MTEKRCFHCKEIKPISEFGKNRSQKDGYQGNCNVCRKIFDSAYAKTDKRKRVLEKYAQTDKFKKTQEKYQKSPKGRLQQKRLREKNPEKIKAREVVNTAINQCKLPRPDSFKCYNCEEQAREYHHTINYEPKNWVKVIPVCSKCHKNIHQTFKVSLITVIGGGVDSS